MEPYALLVKSDKLNWIWFQPEITTLCTLIQSHWHGANKWLNSGCRLIIRSSESPSDIFIIKNLYLKCEVFFQLKCYQKKLTFLIIMTKKGSFMPKVYFSFAGQVIYAVVTLVPIIYKTDDWISWSVNRLICPFWTEIIKKLLDLSQICNGLLPILYKIDKNPDWYVFWNIQRTLFMDWLYYEKR